MITGTKGRQSCKLTSVCHKKGKSLVICVSDNIQITRKSIMTALEARIPDAIIDCVRLCEKQGAHIIDINTGPLSRDPREKMRFFIQTIQEITRLPLMIDTANPVAIEEALACCRQTPYINGFSLEPKKLETILPLAVEYRTPIVGYLLNPDSSVPMNADERMALAITLYDEALKRGLTPEQLIIDPVLVPLSWPNGTEQAMDILTVIRSLPELLGFPVKTIVGLSNLTTGAVDPAKKSLMEQTYAAMLSASGISMVLFNVMNRGTMRTLNAASLLSGKSIFSWEELPKE